MIDRNFIVKVAIKIFWTQCQKFRLKIPYRYREILKKEMARLSYSVNDPVFSQSKSA